jgi:hypothetical protein
LFNASNFFPYFTFFCAIFYLIGIGALLFAILSLGSTAQFKQILFKSNNHPYADRLNATGTLIATGLIINYLIFLLTSSLGQTSALQMSLNIGLPLAIIGLIFLGHSFYKFTNSANNHPPTHNELRHLGRGILVVAATLIILQTVQILSTSYLAWDERSIWLLHAKIILRNGGLIDFPQWHEKLMLRHHFSYPKFVPSLIAQIMSTFTYWNEYIPKIAMALLLLPAFLWLSALFMPTMSFLYLLIMALLPSEMLWSGILDGSSAIFLMLGLIFLVVWLRSGHKTDLVRALVALLLSANQKEEGKLALMALLAAMSIFTIVNRSKILSKVRDLRRSGAIQVSSLFLILLLPRLIWASLCHRWHLPAVFDLGANPVARFVARTQDQTIDLVWRSLYHHTFAGRGLTILAITLILFWLLRRRYAQPTRMLLENSEIFLPALFAIFYFSGLFMVYMLTPYDVEWNLRTSMQRTMLPVHLALFASIYFVLQLQESSVRPEAKEQMDKFSNDKPSRE